MITLLIDGDVEAYKAATISQKTTDWGDGDISVDLDEKGAESYLGSALENYCEALDADRMIVCLSDGDNWRKKLCPDYKANRKDLVRPLLLDRCRQFFFENYMTYCWPRLEADDVMGILATSQKGSVIVSVDKDMRTIPCRLYNPGKPEEGITVVDDVDAYEWHMTQTLTGDAVDGYKGCPGIGKKKAEKIVKEVFDEVNPIQNYSTWRKELWRRIVKAYVDARSTEEAALMNARLAYILRRPGDYNRKTSKVRLWTPPT